MEHLRWTLAHQGGWDELAMFGIPIVLAVVGVRWADRRAKANRAKATTTTRHEPHEGEPDSG